MNDFLLCDVVVWCADGPVLTVDLRRCYTKARREMQSGILASLTPRFTLVMLLSAVHARVCSSVTASSAALWCYMCYIPGTGRQLHSQP